jgi:hypothetical protein
MPLKLKKYEIHSPRLVTFLRTATWTIQIILDSTQFD